MQKGVLFPTLFIYYDYFFCRKVGAGFDCRPVRSWGRLLQTLGVTVTPEMQRGCGKSSSWPRPRPGTEQLPSSCKVGRLWETSWLSLSPSSASLSAPHRAAGSPSTALKGGWERYWEQLSPKWGWEVARSSPGACCSQLGSEQLHHLPQPLAARRYPAGCRWEQSPRAQPKTQPRGAPSIISLLSHRHTALLGGRR